MLSGGAQPYSVLQPGSVSQPGSTSEPAADAGSVESKSAEAAPPAESPSQEETAGHASPLRHRTGEITVTRRLFRSGESEYLMNGRACRLRDIQDLFMGTGLGPESYAIIEQGRIGQILSSKPSDRRAIIEEAAGISKFKTRKRLAEAKLESSKGNLGRITDILLEVTKQVNSLKRQAGKARRYREMSEELRGRLKLVLTSRLIALDAETGKELWAFDPKIDKRRPANLFINRGAAFWSDAERKRVFLGTLDGRLFSIRADSGKLDDAFGTAADARPAMV